MVCIGKFYDQSNVVFHNVIINLISAEDYSEINSKFTKSRSNLPLMFISTPQDKFQSIWTRKQPTAMILQRLVILAKECLSVLESQMADTGLSSSDFKVCTDLSCLQVMSMYASIKKCKSLIVHKNSVVASVKLFIVIKFRFS